MAKSSKDVYPERSADGEWLDPYPERILRLNKHLPGCVEELEYRRVQDKLMINKQISPKRDAQH